MTTKKFFLDKIWEKSKNENRGSLDICLVVLTKNKLVSKDHFSNLNLHCTGLDQKMDQFWTIFFIRGFTVVFQNSNFSRHSAWNVDVGRNFCQNSPQKVSVEHKTHPNKSSVLLFRKKCYFLKFFSIFWNSVKFSQSWVKIRHSRDSLLQI